MSEAKRESWLLQQTTCPLPNVMAPSPNVTTPHLDTAPNPRLKAEGWQRRFTADPIRTREAVQLYTELGYEVHLEAIQPSELSLACGACRLATCHAYQTIYTRKKGNRSGPEVTVT